MKVEFIIDGQQSNEPNNYGEIEIDCKFDKDGNTESVSITNWEFGTENERNSNDSVVSLLKHVDDGKNGKGVGVFEGKPFTINLSDEISKKYQLFDGYIDMSKSKIDCGVIKAPATEQGNIDWLNDTVDSFTFEYLYETGFFSSDYFVPVPYCINKKQNGFEIALALLSIFVITNEIKKQINDIYQKAATVANPFQTATAIAGLILQIGYIAVLLLSLINLLVELFKMIVQPVKYHNGMYLKDLIEIGLNYLGLKLSSSILQQPPMNKIVIIPEKFNLNENNVNAFKNVIGNIKGTKNESVGYYKGTFGDLLRSIHSMFHAKIPMGNGVMNFEKQNFRMTSAQYKLPPVENSEYEFNYDELFANMLITFAVDTQDRNTIQEYEGTAIQIIQSPKVINNKKMVLMRNINEVRIPFALGKRKTELNAIEQIFSAFFNLIGSILNLLTDAINAIITALNGLINTLNKLIKVLKKVGVNLGNGIPSIPTLSPPQFKNLIEDRIGMLKMESDFITTPKMVLIDGPNANPRNNKLAANNESVLNAKYLYENYHYFNNFVTTNGWNNQKLIKRFEGITFTFDDYEKIRTNASIFDADGNECVLESLKFNPIAQTANGVYKQKYVYTNNIKINTIYPNG